MRRSVLGFVGGKVVLGNARKVFDLGWALIRGFVLVSGSLPIPWDLLNSKAFFIQSNERDRRDKYES
jgi:hypothetical protein